MESFFDNGGIIGKKMNFYDTNQYYTEELATFSVVGTPTKTNASATSITLPSGLQENDLVFLCLVADSSVTENSVTGWTNFSYNGGGAPSYSIFYKFMGATPDTSVSGLTSSGSTGCYFSFALRGISTTNMIVNSSGSGNVSGVPALPSVDLSGADVYPCYALALVFLDDDIVTMSGPSGYTVITSGNIGISGSGSSFLASYKEISSAGTESPGSVINGSSDTYYAFTIGLNIGKSITYGSYKNSGIWKIQIPAVA